MPVGAVQDLEDVGGHLELGQRGDGVAAVLVARGGVQVGHDSGSPLLRYVGRLHAVAEDVDVVREVGEPDGGRQVVEGASPVLAARLHKGWAGGARQHGGLAEPYVQVELRSPARDRVARGGGGARPLDECFAEAGALPVHPRSVRLEQRERLGVEDGAADLPKQREGCLVDLAAAPLVEDGPGGSVHACSSAPVLSTCRPRRTLRAARLPSSSSRR